MSDKVVWPSPGEMVRRGYFIYLLLHHRPQRYTATAPDDLLSWPAQAFHTLAGTQRRTGVVDPDAQHT